MSNANCPASPVFARGAGYTYRFVQLSTGNLLNKQASAQPRGRGEGGGVALDLLALPEEGLPGLTIAQRMARTAQRVPHATQRTSRHALRLTHCVARQAPAKNTPTPSIFQAAAARRTGEWARKSRPGSPTFIGPSLSGAAP